MLAISKETRRRIYAKRAQRNERADPLRALLRGAGLRPTRQRMALANLLFRDGRHRHITADDLYQDACAAGRELSLATVYNTLKQFADAGLIRRISVSGERTYFDTDPGDHQHFYIEAEDQIIDVEPGGVDFACLPAAPGGYEIAGVDVVIRLRATEPARASRRRARSRSGPSTPYRKERNPC